MNISKGGRLKKLFMWYLIFLKFPSGVICLSFVPTFWPGHDLKPVSISLHSFPALQLSLASEKLPEFDIYDIISLLISDTLLPCKQHHSLFLCISSTQNIQNSLVSWLGSHWKPNWVFLSLNYDFKEFACVTSAILNMSVLSCEIETGSSWIAEW